MIPLRVVPLLCLFIPLSSSHSGHEQVPLQSEGDWATFHMAEEHHIANMDPPSFFSLHDYDYNGVWTRDEIRRTYGLDDESAKNIDSAKKDSVVDTVMSIFDKSGDGTIDRDEFLDGWWQDGKRLPDFGVHRPHQAIRL